MLQRLTAHVGLLALLLFALLGLTACEDNPTGAGLDLGGFVEESGAPQDTTLLADSLEASSFDDLVGNRSRVLVGASEVPGTYAFSATAYLDFLSASRTDAFREGTVSSAVLYLDPSYVYGDSTSPVTIELRSLADELDTNGATNDTTITVSGPPVRIASVEGQNASLANDRISFLPTDTLLAVTLHQDWFSEFDAALRSEDFIADFHGFQLAPVDPANLNAVSGFDVTGMRLEVISAGDTVSYPAGSIVSNQIATAPNLTKFERLGDYVSDDDRLIVQDGIGTSFEFDFDIPNSLLGTSSLNRGSITLTADTTLLDAPAGFVQPPQTRFTLLGVNDEGNGVWLGESAINDEGELVFSSRSSGDLFFYLRAVLLGEADPFDSYRLGVPSTINTVNYQLFYTDTAPDDDRRPRLQLTVVPID